jgi:hypothetical protein
MVTREAVEWLSAAFGFVERVRIGENHRSQLSVGDAAVIVGDVRRDRRPPRPGEVTHSVMVRVDNANAHCEHARFHGARIIMEPTPAPRAGAPDALATADASAGPEPLDWTTGSAIAQIRRDPPGETGLARDLVLIAARSEGSACRDLA